MVDHGVRYTHRVYRHTALTAIVICNKKMYLCYLLVEIQFPYFVYERSVVVKVP